MKKPIIKSFDKVIVLLLFIFGVFSNCIKPEYGMPVPEYGMIPMYGVPPPKEIKSTIINEEANQDVSIINEIDLQD